MCIRDRAEIKHAVLNVEGDFLHAAEAGRDLGIVDVGEIVAGMLAHFPTGTVKEIDGDVYKRQRMGRPFARNPREAIDRIRNVFPEAALRTSIMVGFPGETEEHFEPVSYTHLDVYKRQAQARLDAAGRNGNAAGGEIHPLVVVQHLKCAGGFAQVEQRLAHAHEDEVADKGVVDAVVAEPHTGLSLIHISKSVIERSAPETISPTKLSMVFGGTWKPVYWVSVGAAYTCLLYTSRCV